MPVVPKVDVEGARHSDDQERDVDPKADGDDERTDRTGVGDRGSRRPAKVEIREIEMIELGHAPQGGTEVRGEKRRDDSETDKTDSDQKPRLERLRELDADTNAEHGEDDRHHHGSPESDHI